MAVTIKKITEYIIECDVCGDEDSCTTFEENVANKADAIKWADMHKIKDGRILCDKCFAEYQSKKSK